MIKTLKRGLYGPAAGEKILGYEALRGLSHTPPPRGWGVGPEVSGIRHFLVIKSGIRGPPQAGNFGMLSGIRIRHRASRAGNLGEVSGTRARIQAVWQV